MASRARPEILGERERQRRERNGEKKVAFYIYGYVGAAVSGGDPGQETAAKGEVNLHSKLQLQLGSQLIAQLAGK